MEGENDVATSDLDATDGGAFDLVIRFRHLPDSAVDSSSQFRLGAKYLCCLVDPQVNPRSERRRVAAASAPHARSARMRAALLANIATSIHLGETTHCQGKPGRRKAIPSISASSSDSWRQPTLCATWTRKSNVTSLSGVAASSNASPTPPRPNAPSAKRSTPARKAPPGSRYVHLPGAPSGAQIVTALGQGWIHRRNHGNADARTTVPKN